MTLSLPSTSIRSSFLKRIPLLSVYKDPRTGYLFQVQEKKLNNTFVRTAVHYMGNDIEPVELGEIPHEMLKVENPTRANVAHLMKNKINELENTVKHLLKQQHKSLYQKIKDLLDHEHYEGDDAFYLLHSGLVIPFKKRRYPSVDDALDAVDKVVKDLFKDSHMLQKMFERQHGIQSKLYQMLMSKENEDDEDEDVKNILL